MTYYDLTPDQQKRYAELQHFLRRFPDPMRTRHIEKVLDICKGTAERWRREYRQTGVLTGPPWHAVTEKHIVYRKHAVIMYLMSVEPAVA